MAGFRKPRPLGSSGKVVKTKMKVKMKMMKKKKMMMMMRIVTEFAICISSIRITEMERGSKRKTRIGSGSH